MGKQEDTIDAREDWHWRNSMRPVRFFMLDARAGIPFFVLLVYFRPITIFIAILSTIVFYTFEKQGKTFPAAMRAFRSWLNGQDRPAWISLRRRRFLDYG